MAQKADSVKWDEEHKRALSTEIALPFGLYDIEDFMALKVIVVKKESGAYESHS
jgi:hypothetical protein